MSTKLLFPCALLLAALGACGVRAQTLSAPRPEDLLQGAETGTGAAAAPEGTPVPAPTRPPASLSPWITYTCPECSGPIGADGPIMYELFARSGFSLPVEGKIFGHVLETGWDIEAGGRSMFFDREMDAAWFVSLSLSNILNHGQHSDILIPYSVSVAGATNPITGLPGPSTTQTIAVSVRELNRTYGNVGVGRDWYLGLPASICGHTRCRVGLEVGGRFGSAKAEFNEQAHKTSITDAAYTALNADVEHPCGCCTFLCGFRAEWDYTWVDHILQQTNSDMMDVNLLFEFGVRF